MHIEFRQKIVLAYLLILALGASLALITYKAGQSMMASSTPLGGGEFVVDNTNLIIAMMTLFSIAIFLISIFIAYYVYKHFRDLAERKILAMFPERNPISVSQLDINGNVLYTNPSSIKLLKKIGSTSENPTCLMPENLIDTLNELRESKEHIKRYEYARGDCILQCDAHYLTDLSVFHLYIEDITKRKHTEESLYKSELRYRALYDDNPSVFFTLDPDGKILSVNNYGANQLGYSRDEIIGTSFYNFFHEDDVEKCRQYISQILSDTEKIHHLETKKKCKDGTFLWVCETARAVHDIDDNLQILVVSEDVTEARGLSEELSYQASHDSLTGLINRRKFEQLLKALLARAKRDSSEHFLCYVDLDQFKVINDTCGHLAGDELLRRLSVLLKEKLRKTDTVARLGGDEFAILIEQCAITEAWKIAETLRLAVNNFPFEFDGKKFQIGASIGLVSINENSHDINDILSLADSACYAAKDLGRNCVHIYDETDTKIVEQRGQMRWVSRINGAIQEDKFVLYYQTIMPLSSDDSLDYFELLIRMVDEDGSTIPPGAFLPAAERYNLSSKLDQWVIHTAFNWLYDNPDILERVGHCGLNLSGQSLGDSSLLNFITSELIDKNIPLHKICFEITETAAIANLENAVAFIKTLRDLGCKFALDDFGSGLSSFAYLKNLPVDFLKIDGAFVKDIVDSPVDHAMVSSIHQVGKALGIKTIAEFVENNEILMKLEEIGIDYAQGYGIALPKPITAFQSIKQITTPEPDLSEINSSLTSIA